MTATTRTLRPRWFAIPVALLAGVAAVAYFVWPPTPAETIPDDEYRSLLAALPARPGEEAYTTIPWELNLLDARQKAAAERKPLLIWTMDGHPLGCG
jgi:hypothetical protein